MNVLSLCSGAGGFDLGFQRAGHTIVGQCEIDPIARSVLRRHWPDTPCHEDIRTLDGTQYRGVDIVIGGTPCQDLSIAGKRAGLEGKRSGLWWEMARIIGEAKPRFAVWENVAGSLSSHGGRDFGVILDSLANLGALDISYRILDAQYFGVAQRRRRVFVVADFGGECSGEILFEPEGSSRNTPPSRTPGAVIATALDQGAGGADDNDAQGNRLVAVGMADRPEIAATLTSQNTTIDRAGFAQGPVNYVVASTLRASDRNARPDGSDNLAVQSVALRGRDGGATAELGGDTATALRASQGGGDNAHVLVAPVDFLKVTSKANRTRVEYGLPANTLHSRGQSVIGPQLGVRRLTPAECERLMGWPDNWTERTHDGKPIADSHRYRMIGNGVVASVAEWIGRRLIATHEVGLAA